MVIMQNKENPAFHDVVDDNRRILFTCASYQDAKNAVDVYERYGPYDELPDEIQDQLDKYDDIVEELEDDIEDLHEEIDEKISENDQLRDEIMDLREEIRQLHVDLGIQRQ